MDNVIEVENLKKSFGEIRAVDDLSFSVREGSLFAFLGENGAGKSTTINILCSILKKDSGKVRIGGEDLDANPAGAKAGVGVVFQGSVLDGKLSVSENLRARCALYGLTGEAAKARIAAVSEVLELGELLKRPYGKLSGGQRRRTDIARALLSEPKILFLDEPTTGLDPQTRRTVWEVLESLRARRNLTIFLTTHYMEEAARADDVLILDEGRLAERGSPDELKRRLTSDTLRIFSPENPALERALEGEGFVFRRVGGVYEAETGCRIGAEFALAHRELVPDFEIRKGDMDDVFLKVTGKKLEGA